jgi:hypothetical protein
MFLTESLCKACMSSPELRGRDVVLSESRRAFYTTSNFRNTVYRDTEPVLELTNWSDHNVLLANTRSALCLRSTHWTTH